MLLIAKEHSTMKDTRYKKLTGLHTGHTYVVTAPANEMQSPMQWTLQCEQEKAQVLVVGENELADKGRWQSLG
jgi:hypothetical protein